MIDAGRHVMPVRAGADEKRRLARGDILGREPCEWRSTSISDFPRGRSNFSTTPPGMSAKSSAMSRRRSRGAFRRDPRCSGMVAHLDLLAGPLD